VDAGECGVMSIPCTKFDHLILRKIIKIVATRCQILRPNCLLAEAVPQTSLGSLQRSPETPSWILGVLLLREWSAEERRVEKRKGKGREGRPLCKSYSYYHSILIN